MTIKQTYARRLRPYGVPSAAFSTDDGFSSRVELNIGLEDSVAVATANETNVSPMDRSGKTASVYHVLMVLYSIFYQFMSFTVCRGSSLSPR